jgi:hypothetical protein
MAMGQIPHEGLVMFKRLPQRYVQFDVECDLVRYESKVETTMKIHL